MNPIKIDKNTVIEESTIINGYPCVVIFYTEMAHRCGYVQIDVPSNYDYNNYDYEVHGGITFAGDLFDNGVTYIGFDCAHAYDKKDIPTAKEYGINEGALEHIEHFLNLPDTEIRTKDYVLEELKNLTEQIREEQEKKH